MHESGVLTHGEEGEVVLYQPNDTIRLEVKLEQETVWLTQQQIAMLMGTNVPAISKHIANIYSTKELNKTATVSKMEIVRVEGSRLVKRSVDHYNLDMIISVGYRVNSVNATAFRRWATSVLKQHFLRWTGGECLRKCIDQDYKNWVHPKD